LGDNNYPINPTMRITNSSTTTIPGGTRVEFDYGTSAPGSMTDQSGFGLAVATRGHSGPNAGGLRGDFQHVVVTLPSWQAIAPGASVDLRLNYYMPISSPSNFTFTFGGTSYVIAGDLPRGGGAPPTSTTTSSTTTTTTTTTTTNPGGSAWAPNTYYATGVQVTYGGMTYRCRQAHTSLTGWEPPNVPALWERV
jgi:chitinase